jgi:ABC-2 type transport system ATP-binding protein
VANLAARGKAILYTSHILEVVERLCTRVIVLHEGRVVADDSVHQLRTTLASSSLEQVFAHLVLRREPERLAQDIADVVTAGA